MKQVRWATLTIFVTSLLLVQACGDDDGGGDETPECAEQICEPGADHCIGNAKASCGSDGLSYTLNDCGVGAYCEGGACTPRDCIFVGFSKCIGNAVNTCNAPGFFPTAPTECGDGFQCAAGDCRATPCTQGDTVCGYGTVATCEDGSKWVETDCATEEACVDGACVARTCVPGTVSCDGEARSQTCNVAGSAWTPSDCPSRTACLEAYGTCEKILCEDQSITDPDAGGTDGDPDAGGDIEEDTGPPPDDTGPPAELEPLDKAEVTIDGEKVVFTSNKSATYVESDKDLRVTMDKGLIKVELSIKPIEEFDVGIFKSTEASDVSVLVLYNDGSDIGGAQWKYQSVDYDVDLQKFQTKGGRVKGTFSGSFTPDGGVTTIPFESGVFDVKRHD